MAEETSDPRIYLAAERTFLAWLRTGLALMGFGFMDGGVAWRKRLTTEGGKGWS